MIQKDKELLLKDLCNRLPYGVMVQPAGSAVAHKVIGYDKGLVRVDIDVRYDLENVKPYLRPLSSMTEEEEKEYINIDNRSYTCPIAYAHKPASDRIEWLNTHHFDYRNLICKGLAIAVREDNNPYKE